MLTKTLKFDENVLAVLRSMQWEDNGRLGKIKTQLDRQLYASVNKALEAMGGQWSRKAGGHVFHADPRPQVEGLLQNGSLTVVKDGFFETPFAVVDRMLQLAPLPDKLIYTVLEPSAGMGAIVRALLDYGVPEQSMTLVEKNLQRFEALVDKFPLAHVERGDFLQISSVSKFDRIYMNPPFEAGQDVDHVIKAHTMLAKGGILVSVMGEHAFFASESKAISFRRWLNDVGGVAVKLPANSFHASGTDVNTRIVIIKK